MVVTFCVSYTSLNAARAISLHTPAALLTKCPLRPHELASLLEGMS